MNVFQSSSTGTKTNVMTKTNQQASNLMALTTRRIIKSILNKYLKLNFFLFLKLYTFLFINDNYLIMTLWFMRVYLHEVIFECFSEAKETHFAEILAVMFLT